MIARDMPIPLEINYGLKTMRKRLFRPLRDVVALPAMNDLPIYCAYSTFLSD